MPYKSVADRRKWQRKNYATNREEIAAKRKKEFDEDPELREQIRQRQRDYRARKRVERKAVEGIEVKIEDVVKAEKSTLHKPKKFRVHEPGTGRSVVVLMYPISYLARACKTSKTNVQKMAQKGVIPDDQIFRAANNYRIFTEDQIEIIAKRYRELSVHRYPDGRMKKKDGQSVRRRKFLPELKELLLEEWQNLVSGINPERFEEQEKINE